jgi:tetratricopeptide (TPR) repeat protein
MKTVITDCRRKFVKLYSEQQQDNTLSAFEFVKTFESEEGLTGDANDFHNFATELARVDYYEAACEVLKQGILMYSTDTDLLADYILYAHKCGKHEVAREKFQQLKAIDKVDWTWRGYVFSVDYLVDIIKGQKGDERKKTQNDIESLISDFKKNLKQEEKAYLAESDYFEAIGERDKAIEVLKGVVDGNIVKVCPQCCARFIDRSLENGDYNTVATYAKRGISMAEEQESVETIMFWYYWALADDHKWFNENLSAEEPDKSSARRVIRLYDTAISLDNNKRYTASCKKRKNMIATFVGIDLPKEENSIDEMAQLLRFVSQNKEQSS